MMTGMFMLFNNDEYKEPIERIIRVLLDLGLTLNEAKVYVYLAKTGYRKAIEIAENIGIPRTETYQILNRLQSRGLVIATMEHPVRYAAVEFNDLLKTMINVSMERLKEFDRRREEILQVWNNLPEFAKTSCDDKDRFQILEGRDNVYARISSMVADAGELLMICNEVDALRMYNYGIIDVIAKCSNVKIISSVSPSMASVFMDVGLSNVRRIESKFPLVIIKDRKEMVHVIRERNKNDTAAIWTDSTALIESILALFSMLWKDVDDSKQ
ncbi:MULTISPECIES: TrmB family transcriptional regulator [Candidatus Nitrosocaldus]|jgi:sugar-specific transcriptional regulator TrmB|uniref:Putative Transcriptional regulator TrmB n=1 Tax=Candidatus Nitrosocaldus cavascurensis TaxID=2058097 RepID=A0A2K5AP61_9ARCH|nr:MULTISPECIES: helix-turn-helix domain-containing protein [Candidatus Nitrosocaldus]SPC33433.1 putative Transcriptional regulator TrmB [Candidatus Nitrosocaldus cavascurensis]